MGNEGNAPLYDLDKALERRDFPAAWFAAVETPYVPLDRALRLTMLMSEEKASGYEAACRRFLARFLKEQAPTMEQVKHVADALQVLGEPGSFAMIEARSALADLARQLRP